MTNKAVSVGDTVTLHYRGTLDDGTEFDSSYERGEPMNVTVGSGNLISGFDSALHGMSQGETKTFTLSPDEAYGDHHPERATTIARTVFPEEVDLSNGSKVPLQGPEGMTFLATVTESTDNEVSFDLNHPMAGKTLTFEVEVLTVGD
jgi:peptidylprolyl isomerase